jgi:uncharacterized protein YjbJ (UPF0337 family)
MTTDDQDRKDMGDHGREHEGKGMIDKVAGKVQEGVGKLTGDRSEEAKGKLRQGQGSLESAVGSAEQKLDDATK